MRARLIVVLGVCLAAMLRLDGAAADDGGALASPTPSGDVAVSVGTPGSQAPPRAAGTGTVTCRLYERIPGLFPSDPETPPTVDPEEGRSYWVKCWNGDGVLIYMNWITYQPGQPMIDAGTLGRQAYKELPLPYPDPHVNPTPPALVGLKTWAWIDSAAWNKRSATAEVPGLAATVTARPATVTWDFGDGTTVTCDGPGVPWDQSNPDAQTNCGHVYQHFSHDRADGVYHASATIRWRVTWTATNGAGGSLPDVNRTTNFDLDVQEVEAIITG